jgi:hypothetical protein
MSVQGNFQRHMHLATHLEMAYAYFTDYNHILPRLPEVDRVMRYRDGRYRMIFMADDGRGHDMGVVFDIKHEVVENRMVKMVSIPVSPHELAGDRLAKGQAPLFPGLMNGEVLLNDRVGHVEVSYRLNLLIQIEVPGFLYFIPKPVLQKIGDGLMQYKLHSVGDGFAERLVDDFGDWHNRNAVRVAAGQTVTRPATGESVPRGSGLAPELN